VQKASWFLPFVKLWGWTLLDMKEHASLALAVSRIREPINLETDL
jgi:hypothetical protein